MIFKAIVAGIILAAVLKACMDFLGSWADMLFHRCVEYRYAVYYTFVTEERWGRGSAQITMKQKLTGLDQLRFVERSVKDEHGLEDVSVTGFNFLGKKNIAPILAIRWLKRALTRTADDALAEYKAATA